MEVSIVGYFSHLQISAVLHTDESVINYFDSKCLSIDISIQSRENDRETEEKKTKCSCFENSMSEIHLCGIF